MMKAQLSEARLYLKAAAAYRVAVAPRLEKLVRYSGRGSLTNYVRGRLIVALFASCPTKPDYRDAFCYSRRGQSVLRDSLYTKKSPNEMFSFTHRLNAVLQNMHVRYKDLQRICHLTSA